MRNDTNQVIFRAARSSQESDELINLYRAVYCNSRLAGVLSSGCQESDKWDSVSTHYGLYQCNGAPEENDRAIGYVRVSPCDPQARRLPQHDYAPTVCKAIDGIVEEAIAGEREIVSIGHLALHSSARSMKMGRTLVGCTFAALIATGVDTALFTANKSHARLYGKFGIIEPSGLGDVSFELAGNDMTLLQGRAQWLPSPAKEIVSALARQFAREGQISFTLRPARTQRLPKFAALKRVA